MVYTIKTKAMKQQSSKAKPKTTQAKSSGANKTMSEAMVKIARANAGPVQLPKPAVLPPYVQCLIDPAGAPATKLPDDYVSVTGSHKVIHEFDVTTDAAGRACFQIRPSLINIQNDFPITQNAGPPVTLTTGAVVTKQHSDYTLLFGAYGRARTVAMGIEIHYTGAPLNASGKMIALELDSHVSLVGVDLNTLVDDGESEPLINGRYVVVRPTQAPRFEDISASGYMDGTFHHWGFIILGGPPSTQICSVTVTTHFEGIPRKGNLHAKSATPELYNPDHMAMGANLGQVGVMGAVTAAGKKLMIEAGTKAANLAWNNLGPQVAQTIGKYGGRAAGYAGESLLALM